MATAHRERARSETSLYLCTACGTTALRWVGRCPGCEEWNTFAAAPVRVHRGAGDAGAGTVPAVALRDVSSDGARPLPTGVSSSTASWVVASWRDR